MVLVLDPGIEAGGLAASLEDFEAEVTAAFGPFVVLLGQHRADQAGDGIAVGEDPDYIGAATDLLVQPLVGIVRPDLGPHVLGECGEGQDLGPGAVEVIMNGRQFGFDVVQGPVNLSV